MSPMTTEQLLALTPYVVCDTKPGPFSNEKMVKIIDAKGNEHIGFFPDALIKDNALKVEIYTFDATNRMFQIRTMQSGGYGFFDEGIIWVSENQIVFK